MFLLPVISPSVAAGTATPSSSEEGLGGRRKSGGYRGFSRGFSYQIHLPKRHILNFWFNDTKF